MGQERVLEVSDLQALYRDGVNLMRFLGGEGATNEIATILASYDTQAGSYVARMADQAYREGQEAFSKEVAGVLNSLRPASLLDAGTGEATSLSGILQGLDQAPSSVHAFDLSWSRIDVARQWLGGQGLDTNLCVGELTRLPYLDNSFEVVMTNQSIEPNRGRERQILDEIYRVTGRYALLVEPSYGLAGGDERERMDHHRYCQDLPQHAEAAGFQVVRHTLLERPLSASNPTAFLLLEKVAGKVRERPGFACPMSQTPLTMQRGHLVSAHSGFVYPVLDGIPCLLADRGIFASHFARDGHGQAQTQSPEAAAES